MDLRNHFSARKNHIGAEARRSIAGKKLGVDLTPAPAKLDQSPAPAKLDQTTKCSPEIDSGESDSPMRSLLARLPPRKTLQSGGTNGVPSMTILEFRNNPKRQAALRDFSASVEALASSPEKLQQSPYYSPHKTVLSNVQGRAKLQHAHVRKQLFSRAPGPVLPSDSSPVKSGEDEEEASTSKTEEKMEVRKKAEKVSKSINQPKGTPVKDQSTESTNQSEESPAKSQSDESANQLNKTPVKNRVADSGTFLKSPGKRMLLKSPGKRMLLYSPSKGLVQRDVATAASVHADAVEKEKEKEEGVGGKRKAEFDRTELKKRLENFAVLRKGVTLRGTGETSGDADVTKGMKKGAGEKFADLAEAEAEAEAEVFLPFPSSFKSLEEIFHKMDTLLALNHRQTTYFPKLQHNMLHTTQQLLNRPLDYTDLGRIKAVFPEAFIFRAEKPPQGVGSLAPLGSCTLAPLGGPGDTEELAIYTRDDTKNISEGEIFFCEKIFPKKLILRKKKFHFLLKNHLFEVHEKFLKALTPPLFVERERLTHWHPKFPLNEVNFLPEPVELSKFERRKKGRTAAEVLALTSQAHLLRSAKDLMTLPEKPKVLPLALKPRLRKLDPEFLAKIRANEAKKAARIMTKNPAVEKRLAILEHIPPMARIILNIFSSKQKGVLEVSEVEKILRASMTIKLTTEEFREHMDVLMEVFTEKWLLQLRYKGLYLKIENTSVGLNEIDVIINEEVARLKKL